MRRLLVTLVVLGWPMGVMAAPAAAAGDCVATFNGVAVDRIAVVTSPLELLTTETLVFAGTAPGGTSTARVAVIAGPVTVEAASTAYAAPSDAFSVSLDLGRIAPYAVGLYRIRGTVDGCVIEGWLRITGRFPLATLAGLAGAALALGGVAGQLGAIASRRRWSRFGAAFGGLATGSGAAVIAQQAGVLQASYIALGGAVAAAVFLGVLLASLVDRSGRERRRRRLDEIPLPVAEAAQRMIRPPNPTPPEPIPGPFWGYVLAEIDVFDLTDHTRVVGRLRPGSWYLVKRELGSWAQVSGGEGLEGWAARSGIHRQG